MKNGHVKLDLSQIPNADMLPVVMKEGSLEDVLASLKHAIVDLPPEDMAKLVNGAWTEACYEHAYAVVRMLQPNNAWRAESFGLYGPCPVPECGRIATTEVYYEKDGPMQPPFLLPPFALPRFVKASECVCLEA